MNANSNFIKEGNSLSAIFHKILKAEYTGQFIHHETKVKHSQPLLKIQMILQNYQMITA